MSKILITGANSFIGYRLCRKFSERGDVVYAVIRKGCKNEEVLRQMKNVMIIYLEMRQYCNIRNAIGTSCDTAIFLAWDGTRGGDRDNVDKQRCNYERTLTALEECIALGCKTIVTAGSQAEYGPRKHMEKVTEEEECVPNTEYGKYKLQFFADAVRECALHHVRLIEPRFFSLYGPDDSDRTMIVSIIKNMLQDKPCLLTECRQIWDFLYIDDAVEGIVGLIDSPKAEGVYNFGSGQSYLLRHYIEIMQKETVTKSELLYGAVQYPASGIVHTNPSVKKLLTDIGWKPSTDFEKGIKTVIEECRKQIKGGG